MRLIQDLTKLRSDLENIIGSSIQESTIEVFIKRWNIAAENYNNYSILRKEFKEQIKEIDNYIDNMRFTISILKKAKREIKQDNSYDNCDYSCIDSTINFMENKILTELVYRDYADHKKATLKSKDSQLSEAIFQLFKFGESIGLDTKSESGAGRGNKNKSFELFQYVTGINNKKTFFYHRDEYLKSKTVAGSVKRAMPYAKDAFNIAKRIQACEIHKNVLLRKHK